MKQWIKQLSLTIPLPLMCLVISMIGVGCASSSKIPRPQKVIEPGPIAKREPRPLSKHGQTRVDHYYWMKDKKSHEVLQHLKQENHYADQALKKITGDLSAKIFEELKSRIKKDQNTVPYSFGKYYYYQKFSKNQEYPQYMRFPLGRSTQKESLVLDVNQLAKDHPYIKVDNFSPSRDNRVLAYAMDTKGDLKFSIVVRDGRGKKTLRKTAQDLSSNFVWLDTKGTKIAYVKPDPVTYRPYRVYIWNVVTDQKRLIFEEKDPAYAAYVSTDRDYRYLLISSHSTETTEYQTVQLGKSIKKPQVFTPRREGHRYYLEFDQTRWLVLSNDQAQNFKIAEAPLHPTPPSEWKMIVAHQKNTLIESVTAFKSFVTWTQRKDGLVNLRIWDRKSQEIHSVELPEALHMVSIDKNPHYDQKHLRITYQSMVTPLSVYDYYPADRRLDLKKQQKILPSYDSSQYVTKREWIQARDGTRVPVSLVHEKSLKPSGNNPILIYGYGAYGSSIDPYFSANRLSLLSRGFVFAIAHVRGGAELGDQWYRDGKLQNKLNTFNDFVDVTKGLVKLGYAHPDRVFAMGDSAGGLLMGAAINQAPELFRGVVAHVPFVDVLTTMLDETIPLTTEEYDEWGNPNRAADYQYIAQYSPYDNIGSGRYPHLFVTAGLNDSQVQYWEPAKWVAKLRHLKPKGQLIILRTEMQSGHGGNSGRFKALEQAATAQSFIIGLDQYEPLIR